MLIRCFRKGVNEKSRITLTKTVDDICVLFTAAATEDWFRLSDSMSLNATPTYDLKDLTKKKHFL